MVKDVRLRLLLSLIFILLSTFSYADNPPETLYDEGVKQGIAFKINCVGAGIACTTSGSTGTLTVAGGGGSGTNYWSLSPGNIGINTTNNVGIGTVTPIALLHINSSAAQDLFRVDDTAGSDSTPFIIDQTGNVGIGTAVPQAIVAISSTLNQTLFRVDDNGNGDLSPFIIDANGNVGIGTVNTERDKLLVMGGNVGIGTWVPSTALDVAGTTVTQGFRLSTNPSAGFTLVSDSTGIGTWMAATTLPISSSQWVTQNTTDVSLAGGNVGIGTTATTTAAFTVMNGNVGIGTWKPQSALQVNGNIGIGTTIPSVQLEIGNRVITMNTAGQLKISADNGSLILAGNSGTAVTTLGINGGGITTSGTGTFGTNAAIDFHGVAVNGNAIFGGKSVTAASFTLFEGGASPSSSMVFQPTIGTVGNGDFINFQVGNLGVGTVSNALKIVSGGNVGLGTSWPVQRFSVVGGGIGIGTVSMGDNFISTNPPNGGMIIEGNVGIGSWAPQATIDLGTSGTIRSNRTSGIGFTLKSGANTACNTTCGSSACVFGEDSGTVGVLNSNIVSCTDASGDNCICAGP